jgi:hypothetical protein
VWALARSSAAPPRTVSAAVARVPLAPDQLHAHHLASGDDRLPHAVLVRAGGQPAWGGGVGGGAKNSAGIHCLANREALQQACERAGPEISAGMPSRTEPPPHL